jgi:putative DNA primase/helicase
MSGVLLRALRGLTRLRRQGQFSSGKAMRQAQAEFRREADSVALWLQDFVPPGKRTRLKRGKPLYVEYQVWCNSNGHHALSAQRMYARLRDWTPTDEMSVTAAPSHGYEYFTVDSRGSGG